ncbi:uracil-DNA glycosylase family protein [Lactococcus petauri]|uniref:uracil-DNA glycosylase family protein n=1 Tax=Lactococcus petauri TaxID=1940789 RepID=UPI00178124E5|nr:uracil-DNA glycosylase family protein [Lactococcus petauri]MBD5824115.1 uracil-DNA glycosylase family protein [Lactococcus petauri]MDC0825318.1 uracil-DNA glycosylase family protein [Lactococcus petauri]USI66084.1 uracil-DNA glycosylase family protein [Lactococcus petauri]
MDKLSKIFQAIKEDPQNTSYTAQGIDPLYSAHQEAKILIVGQAPGIRAQESRLFWNDPSGDRLREWLGISYEEFYSSSKLAILPMDFYFPGKGKSGDLPPRKGFAEKWHPLLIKEMPQLELIVLIGSYAIPYYLNVPKKTRITDVVRDFENYLPEYFPLVHPSPRNNIWLRKNPWFEAQVLPELKIRVKNLLA